MKNKAHTHEYVRHQSGDGSHYCRVIGCGFRVPSNLTHSIQHLIVISKFRPLLLSGDPCRRTGWYVQDLQRSTPNAVVIIGGRHDTQIQAQSEARRLELESTSSKDSKASPKPKGWCDGCNGVLCRCEQRG